jgi:hypothetical protein
LRGKRAGRECSKPAGWGTDHPGVGACKLHGGSTPTGIKHAQAVGAVVAVQTYGLPVDVDPQTALLEELARTAGHVKWLGEKVGTLDEEQAAGPVGSEGTTAEGVTHHPHAEPSVWIRLYQAERKHLADVAATCVKVGIEQRRVRLAEEQGALLAQVLRAVLADLNVLDRPETPGIVRKHLALVAGEASG